jgi:hypothetical protein
MRSCMRDTPVCAHPACHELLASKRGIVARGGAHTAGYRGTSLKRKRIPLEDYTADLCLGS